MDPEAAKKIFNPNPRQITGLFAQMPLNAYSNIHLVSKKKNRNQSELMKGWRWKEKDSSIQDLINLTGATLECLAKLLDPEIQEEAL